MLRIRIAVALLGLLFLLNAAADEGLANGDVPASPGYLTVTGKWKFYPRNDPGGIHDAVPVSNCLVRLFSGADHIYHLAEDYTRSDGSYSLGPVENPGDVGVFVRIYAYDKYAPNDELMVVRAGGGNILDDTYDWSTEIHVFPDGTHDVGTFRIPPASQDWHTKAWWIKDDLERGYWYRPGTGSYIAEWPVSSTGCIVGGHIRLQANDANNTSDTVLHEMGHNVMYNIYGHWPPGDCPSPHVLGDAYNQYCAWQEGWAESWHMMVNNDPMRNWETGESPDDLEHTTWGVPDWWQNGDTVIGRVAGALWDIGDYGEEPNYDYYGEGFNNVWNVFSSQRDNTLAEFWEAWKAGGTRNVYDVTHCLYQNTIDYETCWGDETMTFEPANPVAGDTVTIRVRSHKPHPYIRLDGYGPPQWQGVTRVGRDYVWTWTVTLPQPGRYDYNFSVQCDDPDQPPPCTLCTTKSLSGKC